MEMFQVPRLKRRVTPLKQASTVTSGRLIRCPGKAKKRKKTKTEHLQSDKRIRGYLKIESLSPDQQNLKKYHFKSTNQKTKGEAKVFNNKRTHKRKHANSSRSCSSLSSPSSNSHLHYNDSSNSFELGRKKVKERTKMIKGKKNG